MAQKKRNLPRTHKDYWRNKVAKRQVKGVLATHFSVRLNYNKSREYFNLGTANKLDAADLAKGIYDFLKVNGWDATREKFKPTAEAKLEIETVGDLIAVFTETSTVRERTKSGYKNHLRRLAGDIKRIPDDPSKYRPGGSDWQVKIDRIKLKDITAEKVAAWRRKPFKPSDILLETVEEAKAFYGVDPEAEEAETITLHQARRQIERWGSVKASNAEEATAELYDMGHAIPAEPTRQQWELTKSGRECLLASNGKLTASPIPERDRVENYATYTIQSQMAI